MLQSSLTKHLLKADILFRREFEIIPVDSGICRCRASDPLFRGCHQSGSLSGVTRERHPTSQSEHLCMPKNFSAYKGTARCSRCGNKTPHCGSLVPRIENPTRITPAAHGFQGAILRRCGESGKPFGRPPAVRSGQPLRGPRWRIILRTEARKNGCGIVRRRASARASRQDRFAANIFRQIRE